LHLQKSTKTLGPFS